MTKKFYKRRFRNCKRKNEQDQYIIKGRLSEKENEIEQLMQNDKVKEDALATLSDQTHETSKAYGRDGKA